MARRVIGLDLGAYSVKLVRLECGNKTPKFQVLDQVEELLPSQENEGPDLLSLQKEAIKRLQEKGYLESETCATALDAAFGQMLMMKAPFLESRKIEAILPGLLEAELPFETDDMIISWHRAEDPVRAVGAPKPPESTIRIAFGKKEGMAGLLQMLQAVPLDPRFVHLANTTPFELVRELGFETVQAMPETGEQGEACIIDFGHRATNLCIFDRVGIKYSRTFLRGGKKLTEEIAQALSISFDDAEKLKHDADVLAKNPSEQQEVVNRLVREHYRKLCDELTRVFISLKTNDALHVRSVLFVGGGSKTNSLSDFLRPLLAQQEVNICSPDNLLKHGLSSPAMAMSFALSLSCLQIHAKDNRFNFRKDEFVWRGDLDFLRTKSTPLILWTLVIICSTTVMWSANSLVLQKENSSLELRLKAVCTQILGQVNIPAKKCLALMQEQITTSSEVAIPEYTASDIYIKASELLPKELNVTFSELDVSEKKVRITAEVPSFEDVDKLATHLGRIPCLVNIEKGSAQKKDAVVKVAFNGDIDCNPAQPKSKVEQKTEVKSKPEPKK